MYPAGTNGKLDVANVAVEDVVDVRLTDCTLMLPPVIVTLFEFCVDIVPRPVTWLLVMLIAVLDAAVI